MMRPGLTKRQAEVLAYIRQYHAAHGFAPTMGSIADALRLRALATVHTHVEHLRVKGYVVREYQRARSMTLVDEPASGHAVRDAYDAGWRDCLANEMVGRLPGAQFVPGARERMRARYLERRDGDE